MKLGSDRCEVSCRDLPAVRHLEGVADPAVSTDCQNWEYHGPDVVAP
jgi:hypothetical protein